MATERKIAPKGISPREQARRRQVIALMLAERDQRQPVSREEIRKMRDEGRY